MPYKLFITLLISFSLSGCAERSISITDSKGDVVGGYIAGYDWHFYGLQDSIDYMLYKCAEDSIAKGYKISDERLLVLDFTLPPPPEGKSWNRKLAMHHFHEGNISETKLGYILADIEYQYVLVIQSAEEDLATGKVTQAEFDEITKAAKLQWLGE
ncbi:hypothetical protein GCM10011369_35850 [Neiella marina]|uniref:Lipoprotein n=1 Tax=Neiella marina TaxID=508461 RepID=A0A8J2UAG0_9GAMM|nr:hypothetical protein [Neiella marina]GGA90550.1 hypothetical protein GCM10011369_35850 [Neiella marina]